MTNEDESLLAKSGELEMLGLGKRYKFKFRVFVNLRVTFGTKALVVVCISFSSS